jgi:hypothetical protein
VFGAIVIPALGLAGMLALPYLDRDLDADGIWFRSRAGRWLALLSAVLGFVGTAAFVLIDEYWLDLPSLLPFLPTVISNGWIPLAALLLLLIGYAELLNMFKARKCETRQAIFTLLLAAFVTLTLTGIFFRGEGMALVLPWEIL